MVENITAILSSQALSAPALRASVASLGALTSLGASAFAASIPPGAVSLANAPFTVGSTTIVVAAATSASGSSSAAGGAAAGGVIGAFVLALVVWLRRSYSKHKKCPCQRDRKAELFARAEERRLALESTQAKFDSAQAKAELLEVKRQLALAKKAEDADEVAELRRQVSRFVPAPAPAPAPRCCALLPDPSREQPPSPHFSQLAAAKQQVAETTRAEGDASRAGTTNPIAFAPRALS